jgi:hypothetical protein
MRVAATLDSLPRRRDRQGIRCGMLLTGQDFSRPVAPVTAMCSSAVGGFAGGKLIRCIDGDLGGRAAFVFVEGSDRIFLLFWASNGR